MSSNDATPPSPQSLGSSPRQTRGPRPRIVLPTTPHIQSNPLYTASIPITGNIPLTPTNPNEFPFHMYPTKAGDFMFKQFNGFKDFTFNTAKSGMSFGEKIAFWMYNRISSLSKQWFTHIFLFIVIGIYSVGGAMMFVYIEGHEEEIVLKDMRTERFKVLKILKDIANENPAASTEEERQGRSYRELMEYESVLKDFWENKKLLSTSENHKTWTFLNAVFYCGTIYTTIGYGHMYPTTTTGRALTIVYALIGIPLFLIILTDFGKLFTRAIKFLWAFVRRLYYTGSCRKIRRTTGVQEVMKSAHMMYEIATFRRPSHFNVDEENQNATTSVPSNLPTPRSQGDGEPTTPAPSTYQIDDEFNLPITVAIFILVVYMFLGAVIYYIWEEWDFFASFYFVFISMSTIGFGDYVPGHPICMIVSIIYLVFGLALMSMCINVVQLKLSDTFRQASAKLGATIGLRVAEEDGSITTIPPPAIEIADVHDDKAKAELSVPK